MEGVLDIIKIIQETPDVKTFRLKLKDPIKFVSGQYFLASMLNTLPGVLRPFTFASPPDEREFIEFTVKKIGEFTAALHGLEVGDKVKIKGPMGEALNFDENVKQDVVFIAGGSGITPFMSSLRYAVSRNLQNNFILLFSNRTEKDIIFRKELDEMSKLANIKIVNTLSDEIPKDWHGEIGRINKEMILKYVNEPEKKLWYICAPPPMVKAMRDILAEINVPKSNLRIEDWQIAGKHDAQP